MAFGLKSLPASFLVLLLLLQFSRCSSLHADGAEETLNNCSSMKQLNNIRKLLVVSGLEAKQVGFNVAGKSSKEDEEGWELRTAPSGPDPLHHYGADPRKPRTP